MINKEESDFTVVIRSAGERTKEACRHIVLQEVSKDEVQVLELRPFEEALRESYRIGWDSAKKWLITIDADVLPRQGFIRSISGITNDLPDRVFTFKPMIYDKLFFKHRMAGFRVYRTDYLEEALGLIPPNGEQVRPEAYTVAQMEKKGYKALVFEHVVGLHDFEQYYRDIYRKAYFHSYKHMDQIIPVISNWKKEGKKDYDYVVALKGAIDGLASGDEPKPDIRFFENKSKIFLKSTDLYEKGEIELMSIQSKVEEILKKAGEFHKKYKWSSIKKELNEKGIVAGSIFSFGTFLEIAGGKIKSVISRRN